MDNYNDKFLEEIMAVLCNLEKNISIELNLLNNDFLDINTDRSDYQNWIPFTLNVTINGRTLGYSSKVGATFTIFEARNLLEILDAIINTKKKGEKIDRIELSSSEAYFDIVFYETFENNKVYIELWLNTALISNGDNYGYDEGFRFVSEIDNLELFNNELHIQMNAIINNNYYKGFEGEPCIKFIWVKPDNENLTLKIWIGYFDTIMNAINPTNHGWSGLSYYYHLDEGWYDESPWEIPNLNPVIDELLSIDTTSFDLVTKDVFTKLLSLLVNAKEKNDKILISYD